MKILKLSDSTYAKSLAGFHSSYEKGFPQREQFLFQEMKRMNVQFDFYHHGDLRKDDTYVREQVKVTHLMKKYDVVLFDNPFSSYLISHPTTRTKIVFDCIDWYEEMYEKEFPDDGVGLSLLRGGLDRAFRFSHKVICQSPITKEWICSKLGVLPEKAISIPNGYDENVFFPGKSIREELIKDYPEVRGKKLVVFAGKLGKWYEKILDVCDEISRTKDWNLLIVGDGPLSDRVRDYENVIFVGRVPLQDVPKYTRTADVCILPVNDDCPLATMEYFAVGAPVVHFGTRVRWILKDKENGKMVLHKNEWIPFMNYCAENKERIRKNNISKIKGYTWSRLAKKMKSVMEELDDSDIKNPTELGAKISS